MTLLLRSVTMSHAMVTSNVTWFANDGWSHIDDRPGKDDITDREFELCFRRG